MTEERVAIVTGGAGAIGTAIVDALSVDGHRVAVLDREEVNLADAADVRRAAAAIERCDVLVHAAAAWERCTLADFDMEIYRHVQAVNVESALVLAQTFVPGMTQRGFGRIIFVVSNTVYAPPLPNMLPYVASKATLIGLTRTLAHELGGGGIAVTAVAPGLTATPATRSGTPQARFDDVCARQAMPRTLQPNDIAGTVAFLASDGAAALTGQTIVIDGGLVLR
jgi:NAD(P)-dependent dehydrogenase (short-subunit alcohol dehydrogenase family)